MSKNNIRKIKCATECSKENITNPLTLFSSKTTNDNNCITNNINISDLFNMYTECDNKIDKDMVIKNMIFPSFNVDYKFILKMYDITNIDSLDSWLKNNLDNKTEITIFRVINCWILENINNLKTYNNILFNITKPVIIKFTDIKETIIDKELLNFIDYWINKDKDNFNFNLIIDFKNYLSKKYND